MPEVTATTEETKIFNGKVHYRIGVSDLQPGDYIIFYKDGVRVRKVREVIIGRKRRLVKFEPLSTPTFKEQTCNIDKVLSAWRRLRRKI